MSASRRPPQETVIDVPIRCSIVTTQTASALVAAILDLLLFQRKQIPLVYQTFKFMVEKFQPLLERTNEAAWDDYLLERERRCALRTLESIKCLKRNIAQQIDTEDIDRVQILFGSNVLIASEAFEIALPPVNRQHAGANHRSEDAAVVREASMKILTASNQFETKRNSLHTDAATATNVYVLLHTRCAAATCPSSRYILHDRYEAHPKCWHTTIRLRNTAEPVVEEALNCCGELVVFKDLAALQIGVEPTMSMEADVAVAEEAEAVKENGTVTVLGEEAELHETWYESEVFVTGFKDVQVKGKSIWV